VPQQVDEHAHSEALPGTGRNGTAGSTRRNRWYRLAVPTTRAEVRNRPSPRRARAAARPLPLRPLALALLCAGGAVAVWLVVRAHAANHVTLGFERVDGDKVVPPLELTFFPERLAFAAISPPPALGELRTDGSASVSVGRDVVPERAVVRYRGDGVGTGYVHVELGREVPLLKLRAPTPFAGRIGEPIGLWCFGWRCAGLQPVAGAEVVVMGGGEHGVPLASAVTDADGRFVVEGIDGSLDGLGLRIKARGFAIAHEPLPRMRPEASSYPVVAITRGYACVGRVHVPAELDAAKLRVLARGLPGVHTVPSPDGHFVLDHLPIGVQPRLLLDGLPPTWAHAPGSASADAPVRIDVVAGAIVRGRVLDAGTRRPLADALVWCNDGDAVRSDASGRYELARQLPGPAAVGAKWDTAGDPRRRVAFGGTTEVELVAGREHDGVDVLVATDNPR
jgi:hypothetical protein